MREDTKETDGDIDVDFVAKEDLELMALKDTLENDEILGDSLPVGDVVNTKEAVDTRERESITDDVTDIEDIAEFDAEGDPDCV